MNSISRCVWFAATLWLPQFVAFPVIARDFEFGQIRLGEVRARPPANVKATKDCLSKRDVMTCQMKLDDNIWYGFDRDRRLDMKSVYDIRNFGPRWINHRDSVQECKRRLERVTGQKFDIYLQDNGNIHLATRDSIRSESGFYFRIFVIFRHNQMIELAISLEPHEDV
jgi:hypothetical protein